MEQKYYDAKETAQVLKISIPSVYRKAKQGDIPSVGKRPNIQFPREAIDAIAEIDINDDDSHFTFTVSTVADSWAKQEMNHPYEDEDSVPFKSILEWRKRNNNISMNVKQGNKILGWTTFLPLNEEIILNLINSKIRERDIPSDAIRKWSDPNLSVYIPIIEVPEMGNYEKEKEIGAYLIKKTIKWAISLNIQHDIKNWYTVGVTKEGQELAEELGFELLVNLEDGKRKGYVLDGKQKPVKLVRSFIEK